MDWDADELNLLRPSSDKHQVRLMMCRLGKVPALSLRLVWQIRCICTHVSNIWHVALHCTSLPPGRAKGTSEIQNFQHFAKDHFWTFPPVQFSTICQNTSFWTFFWTFQHLAKNSKHASFWTFFPAQCLVGRHKFAKLQICVLTKIKRTSKI